MSGKANACNEKDNRCSPCRELSRALDGNFSHSYASSLSWLCAEKKFCKREDVKLINNHLHVLSVSTSSLSSSLLTHDINSFSKIHFLVNVINFLRNGSISVSTFFFFKSARSQNARFSRREKQNIPFRDFFFWRFLQSWNLKHIFLFLDEDTPWRAKNIKIK